ncbi:ferric reductase-like transmembrane domain-containing protein [Couchioplanes caeruleus]|uniref:ferredoxin reductase family protein n=1 Tax=Couchioplanes caeruleus TaxID=56438 RepID=UPI0020BF3000|nr:ferric reductase-like transmembrane domain-containing protein [Couchioplanes caeruleus]UQU61760.1 ferric reductase-like transmembrane domain-containing protein [Couchioplanes caeruleus]
MTVTTTGRVRLARPQDRIAPPPPPRRWWRDLAGSAAILSVVAVVALWLAGGGVRDLGSGEPATTLGRLTGLVASDLLLLQVLLMARIPAVERAYGQDLLARRHRVLGFLSFWLMLAHVVLITVGYAQSEPASVPGEAWSLVVTYPGMLLAAAGTLLLILVVVLSVRAARRRQRYETWHLLHLYAYLGVGLALPHQLWTGADFTASPMARGYWWGLYGATLAAVLAFRVALPLWRSAHHRLRVDTVVAEAPGVVSVYLRGHRLDRLPVRAGQFFLWRFLDGPGWSRAHPYTLSAAPGRDLLRITVKELGDGSARVRHLRPGTRVLIEGPYGALTADRSTGRRPLLIAAGVGITTMRALLDDLGPAGTGATLLYRIRTRTEAVFRAELDDLGRRYGVHVVYLEGSRPRHGSWLPAHFSRGDDTAALRWLVPDVAEREAYLCGPPPWITAVRTSLRAAGVPDDLIHAEEFAW